MKPFELISYNWDEQRLDVRINVPIKDGYFVLKDIDLETTVYKMRLENLDFILHAFMVPTPRHGFDFQREDFGGFLMELVDKGVVIHKEFLRFRNTNMFKHKQDINDFYHPVFVNYREFFVYDRYSAFNLENCKNVIDAGASVGLFTKYMLNKGAENVISIECDSRSVDALVSNFSRYKNVSIVAKGISSIEGEMELLWKEDNPLVNSLIDSPEFNYENPNKKVVPTTTLENVVRQHNWEKIDLLKLDIEGSEYAVIDSTPDYIFDNTNRILLEYHWPEGRLEGIVERFTELGFEHIFEENRYLNDHNGTVFFYRR